MSAVALPRSVADIIDEFNEKTEGLDVTISAFRAAIGALQTGLCVGGTFGDYSVRADWTPYFSWLENRLFDGDRWAVIPDAPGAPSQVNDGLLNDWPFGRERSVPLWHMDAPVERLGRLCERYSRVALGWTGHPKVEPVGCPRYRKRMDEVAALLGATWPPIHMMRGVAVAFDYPFASADSTSLGQNGHRYDSPFDLIWGDRWAGRRAYADRLENLGKKRL